MHTLTNFIKQSQFCESDGPSANQEIARLVWKPKIRYRSYKGPLLVLVVSRMNPVNTFTPCSFLSSLPYYPPYITW